MRRGLLSALLVFLLLDGIPIAQAQPRPVPVRDPDTPVGIRNTLVKPPPGPDWYVADKNDSGVVFLKRTMVRLHSFYAAALVRELPLGAGVPEDIFQRMRADIQRRSNQGGRFNVLDFQFGAEEQRLGARCARYEFKSEDHAAQGAGGQVLLLTAIGYVCVHPEAPNLFMDMHYSERGGPQDSTAELYKEGEAFLSRVVFSF